MNAIMWRIRIIALKPVLVPVACALGIVIAAFALISYKVVGFDQSSLGTAAPVESSGEFDDEGFLLGEGERRITITTDAFCPYCQEMFEEHEDGIRAMVASSEWEVRLEVVSILEDSAASDAAALTLAESVQAGTEDALGLYLELSDPQLNLGDESSGQLIETSAEGYVTVATVDSAADEHVEWLRSISARNREDVGAVPSARVEDQYITADQLERLLTDAAS